MPAASSFHPGGYRTKLCDFFWVAAIPRSCGCLEAPADLHLKCGGEGRKMTVLQLEGGDVAQSVRAWDS